MAPPVTRRPGFSRRAQFGLFLGYVIAVGGVLFAVLLLFVAVIDPTGFRALRGAAVDGTAPVSAGGRSVVNFFSNGGAAISNYWMAASQNAGLKRDLAASRRQLVEARALQLENKRLKQLLGLSQKMTDDITTTHIVGSSFESGRRLATIWAGSNAGVKVEQPVRGPDGLIGRVLEAGRHAARVLLITDGASNVPVRLVRDGTPALATGRGDGTIDVKPLEVGANRFKRGDLFVSSGTGGIYPPNIPVAVVVRATRDDTIARPIEDPSRANYVIVQQIYQPERELSPEPGVTR